MWKKVTLLFALMSFAGFSAGAADTTLQQLADALDVSTTRTFQFTANGTMYNLGQNNNPAAPWPRFFVKNFVRLYDFTAGAMRDEVVRMGTTSRDIGERRSLVEWGGQRYGTETFEAPQRAHEIVISPHGLLRGIC